MDEEKSQIDLLLDENNTENLKLYDENNKETEFEQVAIIPIDDKIYAILKPVTKITGVNDDEALVFAIEEIDEEDCLVIVEDEEVVDKVFDEYYKLLKEEGYENIAVLFDGIANIEINLEVTFRYFADLIKQNAVFCKEEETLWICTNCGNILGGLCAPTICPICGFPQGYYEQYSPLQ